MLRRCADFVRVGVPLGLEPITNRVAGYLSMVFIRGVPHGGPIPPKTMLRTSEVLEGFGAAYPISLDCVFLGVGVNPLGMKTMLIGLATRVGCGCLGASIVLSMVFSHCKLFPRGFVAGRNGNHA